MICRNLRALGVERSRRLHRTAMIPQAEITCSFQVGQAAPALPQLHRVVVQRASVTILFNGCTVEGLKSKSSVCL